jgi:hypothetical protein
MTPEEIEAMQAAQQGMDQGAGTPPPAEGQPTPEEIAAMQAAQQGMGQPQPQPTPEEIAAAQQALGIDKVNETVGALQEQLKAMEAEKIRAQMQAKYPNVPKDIVDQEIAKVKETNPALAAEMESTEMGLDMAYRAALAGMKPQGTPDNLTQGEGGTGGQQDDLEDRIKTGKADDFALGDYILGNK